MGSYSGLFYPGGERDIFEKRNNVRWKIILYEGDTELSAYKSKLNYNGLFFGIGAQF